MTGHGLSLTLHCGTVVVLSDVVSAGPSHEVRRSLLHGRPVAVKLSRAGSNVEGSLLARVSHPNVVALRARFDGGTVLDWVDAERFDHAFARLSARVAARLSTVAAAAAFDALSHVHAAGIVHRAIGPEHVVVAAGGRVTFLGFGRATTLDDGSHACADVRALGRTILRALPGVDLTECSTAQLRALRVLGHAAAGAFRSAASAHEALLEADATLDGFATTIRFGGGAIATLPSLYSR